MASHQSSEIQLTSCPQHHSDIEPLGDEPISAPTGHEGFSLPPTDGGKDAWLFLFAAFMLEGMIWGLPSSYGVFQAYYSTNEPFAGSKNIAVVGTCGLGLMHLSLTIWFVVLKTFPRFRRPAPLIGLVIMSLSLGLASFSTTVGHLIVAQGVVYAIAGGLAWTPFLFYIEEWFTRRRGTAYGVVIAGLGMSGAIFPPVLEWLLHSYGFRTTLRVCSLSFVALTFPVLFFFKPRLPLSQATQSRGFDMSFWTCSRFLILQSGNIFQSLGYFLPAIYMPTYARSLGASAIEGTLTIILINAASSFGNLCMGAAVDRFQVVNCALTSALGSSIGIFLLWGLSSSLAPLYIFCIIYGGFAGCVSSMYSAIIRDTKEKRRGADSGMIFACLSAGKGVGYMVSGPLSEALLRAGSWHAEKAYGTQYGALITFTGVTALLGGWGFAAKRVGWL